MKGNRRRRWLEPVKTLLIIALTISACVLVYFSPIVQNSGIRSLISAPQEDSSGNSSSVALAAALPVRLAVRSEIGLYGVQYDPDSVSTLFYVTASLMGDALDTAGSPSPVTGSQMQEVLSGPCIFFDYNAYLPLSSLCSWLKEGAENSLLSGSARFLILAPSSDGTLSLYYQSESELFYACSTPMDAALLLDPITEEVTPNGSYFAFEDTSLSDILFPFTLFTSEDTGIYTYLASDPVSPAGGAALSQILTALSFSDQTGAAAGSEFLYTDGYDTLRLSEDGREITYHAAGAGKYSAGSDLTGAVDTAWSLAESTLGTICGDAHLVLLSVQEDPEEDLYLITFGYLLNGCPVYLYSDGWAAQFQVQDGVISDFTLRPRSYASTDQQPLILPAETAASALAALSDTPMELMIQYRDSGEETVEPAWIGL